MKKIILFCLSACLLGMLMLGCPNTDTGTETVTSIQKYTGYVAPAGTIEPASEYVQYMIDAKEQIKPADNEIVLFYYRPDGEYADWSLWMWPTGGDGAENFDAITDKGFSVASVNGKKVGYMKFNTEGTDANGCIPLVGKGLEVIQNYGVFNFIIRQKTDWIKDYGDDLKWNTSLGTNFGTVSGEGIVYEISPTAKPLLIEAAMSNANTIKLTLSQKYAVEPKSGYSNGFVLKSNGEDVAITDMYSEYLTRYKEVTEERRAARNFDKIFIIKTANIPDYNELYISHPSFLPTEGIKIDAAVMLKSSVAETKYDGDDLGITINGSVASFKVFAPLADTVNVLLYDTWSNAKTDIDNVSGNQKITDTLTGGTRVPMSKASDFATTGIWEVSDADVSGKNYYVYEISNFDTVYRVCDINALVAAPDSIAAQIIDIDDESCQPTGWEASYTNPFGNNGADTKSYTEAIIYEMHIRDWSKGLDPNNTGKFDEITAGLGTNGDGVLGQHLKDLGITHVQILPMFDYAQANSDSAYNWGYNPYHYNVPEGRYVNNHDNGGQEAVKQMRAMIKAFHDAGIAVNMDVVYNHTNGTGVGSLYDMTVPYYYYRLSSGKYSNGSGCGNETDSSMPMFRKYMIDSLSHWMKDYHINGFRFDLMGLHEAETMEEVYTALSKIDKNVMVYGEPWTGGTSPVKNSSTKAGKVGNAGYAAFDDDFRNAIKGGEFGGFQKGQVQGVYKDGDIINGLKGTSSRNDTGLSGLSLHYVECHDNYTLFDKLDISILNGTDKTSWKSYSDLTTEQKDAVRAQNKLAAAFVYLGQGTPFMNGGQEFMRTKQGDENSYISSDDINAIDMSFKTKYIDVYNVYKGLIALRHTYDAFTAGTNVTAERVSEGLIKYTVSGTNGDFCVYFNATAGDKSITATGYNKVIDVTDGTLQESETLPTNVGATNFVILKK